MNYKIEYFYILVHDTLACLQIPVELVDLDIIFKGRWDE